MRLQFAAATMLSLGCAFAQPTRTPVEFFRDIQPIFVKHCQGCHGAGQQMSGLRLDAPQAVMQGGNSGPVIVPGNSAESKLIQRVSSAKKGFAMPPVGSPLPAQDIEMLRFWIDQGAKVPSLPATENTKIKSTHWAFQPIQKPTVPSVRNSEWLRNPIDAFILAKLEAEKIKPATEASKTTLIRRVSLDLTGLPPSIAEVNGFLADQGPNAYERLVDRLLASPHYGERWARPWLDLARYADSDGYEKDLVRPGAWRYRHWVIQALNSGMPYDEFTIEQIAGDLLPHPATEQRVATGFHRNALTNREGGVDREEDRFQQTINRANTVGTAWLGLTVGCAQCHNHKYDPISQKEYYQFFAFFNNLEETDIDAPLPGEMGTYIRTRPGYDRDRQEILKKYEVARLQAEWEENIRKAYLNPGANLEWDFAFSAYRTMIDKSVKLIMAGLAGRTARQQEIVTDWFLRNIGPDFTQDKTIQASLKEARTKLQELEAKFTPLTEANTMIENPEPVKTFIALGGDFKSHGIEVQPGTLAVLPPFKPSGTPARLALAQWIVSADNPLTARVAVNRFWQELFGKGLVRTSEDFGTQGQKPSHPELLDWLAAEFRDGGWNMKQIQKTIVMSAAYRQSSRIRPELLTRDPDNSLLARQNRLRLSAELIRDNALAASGLLNPSIGGKSVRPPQPAGVAELGYANSVKWKDNEGPDRYRRGLYIHFQRTTPYPQLVTFDAPDSNTSCTRRERSNTPLQALNLLNDPVFLEAAQGLAMRVIGESPGATVGQRIDYAFQAALARKPTVSERERLSKYFDRQASLNSMLLPLNIPGLDPREASAWAGVSRVILNLDEFITRE